MVDGEEGGGEFVGDRGADQGRVVVVWRLEGGRGLHASSVCLGHDLIIKVEVRSKYPKTVVRQSCLLLFIVKLLGQCSSELNRSKYNQFTNYRDSITVADSGYRGGIEGGLPPGIFIFEPYKPKINLQPFISS